MKKKFFWIFGIALLLLAVSCNLGTNEATQPEGSEPEKGNENTITTLSERLKTASDGDVIDIEKENLTVDSDKFVISKSVTVKNGDLKGATFSVESNEVLSSKRSAASTINFVIDSILNALLNAKAPSNVTMKNTKTDRIRFDSAGVSFTLDNGAKVGELAVNAGECSISSADNTSNIGIVSASEKVSTMEFGGNAKITTLLMADSSKTDVSVATGSSVNIDSSDKDITGATVTNTFTQASADSVYWCKQDETGNDMQPIEAEDGVYSYTIPQSDELWNRWMDIYLGLSTTGNKNYKIVFDVKTDVDAELPLKVRTNYCDGNERVLKTIADTWYPVTIYTGKYIEATERFILELPANTEKNEVTVSLRNLRYVEALDTDENAPLYCTSYYYTTRMTGSVDVTSDGIVTAEFKESAPEWSQFINVFPVTATPGKWNKVSFKVKVENPTTGFRTSLNLLQGNPGFIPVWNFSKTYAEMGTCWTFAMPSSVKDEFTVEGYIHCVSGHDRGPYDDKDADNKPYVKIDVSDSIPNVITLSDFSSTVVESCPFTEYWHQAYVNGADSYNITPVTENFSIKVPANGSTSGKIVFANTANRDLVWATTNLENKKITEIVQTVVWDGEKPNGIKVVADEHDEDYICFVNETENDIYLSVSNDMTKGLHFENNASPVVDDSVAIWEPAGGESLSGTIILADPDKTEWKWSDFTFLELNDLKAGEWYRVTGSVQAKDISLGSNNDSYMELRALYTDQWDDPVFRVFIPADETLITIDSVFQMHSPEKSVYVSAGGCCKGKIIIDDFKVEKTEEVVVSVCPTQWDGWYESIIGTEKTEAGWYKISGTLQSVAEVNPSTWIELKMNDGKTDVLKVQIPADGTETTFEQTINVESDTILTKIIGATVLDAKVSVKNIAIEQTAAPVTQSAWWYADVPVQEDAAGVNIIFNCDGKQTVNIEGLSFENKVQVYDWWTADSSSGKYLASVYEGDEAPTDGPEEGYVRFYWYANFSEGSVPNLYYWWVGSEAFSIAWPGTPMTKVVVE